MRILLVTSRFPYPLWRGDSVRVYHPMRILSRRHEITLVAPMPVGGCGEIPEAIKKVFTRVELVPIPRVTRVLPFINTAFRGEPLQVSMFFHPRIRDKVRLMLKEARYDLMQVALARMGPVIEGLDGRPPAVLDFTDALSLNMERRGEREPWPLNLLFRWEAGRMRRYERYLAAKFDACCICSDADRNVIGAGSSIRVIPNGVDLDDYPFITAGREPGTVIFTGTLWYFPNVNAVTWFVREVWPAVLKQRPGTRFLIAGARPAPEVQRLESVKGVEVAGFVPRIQDYLAKASVAVAPMRSGSGMQNKVIEAMAAGAPVVATPFALGGLAAKNGEHLLVGRDAAEMANHIVHLLQNPEKGRILARNARSLVEKNYDWQVVADMWEELYRGLVSQ